MLVQYVGVFVILVGLVLVLVGVVMVWQDWRASRSLSQGSDFVTALAELLEALAGKPPSTVLFTFGTLLVFLGGIIAGAQGLLQ